MKTIFVYTVTGVAVRLTDLPQRQAARIDGVEDREPGDPLAHRLRLLGFVAGEPVRLVARGLFGADPLLVELGCTRFALRRSEAGRVQVTPDASA